MRRILFTSLMLAACAGAAAQNVGEEPTATFDYDNFFYGTAPIPAEFAKDGKGLFTVTNADLMEQEGIIRSFEIYNDDLELITTVDIESESYQEYTLIKEREGITTAYEIKYNGRWTERKVYDDEQSTNPEGLAVWSNKLSDGNENGIYITQTLFNDDEEYEYIMPIMKQYNYVSYEQDRDYDGDIDYIEEKYEYYLIGFNIKSSSGNTLQTIKMGNDQTIDYLYLIIINDKKYLGVATMDIDDHFSNDELICYPIKPNSTGINPLGAPMKIKVSPRMADRSQSFTVELDGESNAEREVVVVNSAGQTVWKQKVPAGQRTVTIGATRLGKGVNVVRVNGGKGVESCKVIVK